MSVVVTKLKCVYFPLGPKSDMIYFSGEAAGLTAGVNYRCRIYVQGSVTGPDGDSYQNWFPVDDREIPGYTTMCSGAFVAGSVVDAGFPFKLADYKLRMDVYIDRGTHTLASVDDIVDTIEEQAEPSYVAQMMGLEDETTARFRQTKWHIAGGIVFGPDSDDDNYTDKMTYDVVVRKLRRSTLPNEFHSINLRVAIQHRIAVNGVYEERWVPMLEVPLKDYLKLGNDAPVWKPKSSTTDTISVQCGGTPPNSSAGDLYYPDKRKRYVMQAKLVLLDGSGNVVAEHPHTEEFRIPPVRDRKDNGADDDNRAPAPE